MVVGAGGIGCELLKNLALSGFTDIETIDLDTIDVSNLNRQFLFRKQHVGNPKATVAREAVLGFNPNVNIKAFHGNIKESRFGMSYFKKFDIVMNALDNLSARRHVNRLCLAAGVPLIEAGSTGNLGQACVIKKGVTECYECQPKPTPKKYPICTIRSTPSKPVHCIVWAKELYKLLFGERSESMLFEDNEKDSSYMSVVSRRPSSGDAMTYARDVFAAIFKDEIEKKVKMGKYKGADRPPVPLNLTTLVKDDAVMRERTSPSFEERQRSFQEQRRVWDTSTCAQLFLMCVDAMFQTRPDEIGKSVWSKDDRLGLCFVTCASNLRSDIFGIPRHSSFKIKEIAGNIIPAIATTNAIVAGLQVLEAIKILRSAADEDHLRSSCKKVWVNLLSKSRKGHMLTPSALEAPNPQCHVCSATQLCCQIDTEKTTFEHFLHAVLKGKLSFNNPSVEIGDNIVWEEGDDAEDMSHNLKRALNKLGGGGIRDGTIVHVEDFSQELELEIVVQHVSEDTFDEEKTPLKFHLSGKTKKAQPIATTTSVEGSKTDDSEDDVARKAKRKAERAASPLEVTKKCRVEENVEMESDETGDLIVLE